MLSTFDLLDGSPLEGASPPGGDRALAERAFDFVWATGSGMESLDEALAPRDGEATSFEPEAFESDLFVGELARRCMPVFAEGRQRSPHHARLVHVLSHPPRDPEVVARRRAILRELGESDALREAAEAFYARTRDLRDLLESRGASRDRAAEHLRRIGVLQGLVRAVDALTEGFAGATSRLADLAEMGRSASASAAFTRLRELLDWESGASTVELAMRIGSDGRVRAVTMLARRDLPHPAQESAIARFFRGLARVLRGERWDDHEVLARLVDEIMDGVADTAIAVLRAGLDLEPYLASLGLRDRARGAGFDACLPTIVARGSGAGLRFEELYNTFLLADADARGAKPPTPCDVVFDDEAPIAVVTGPNSGGKTRLLQSMGVAVLLGQGGFFVPARAAAFAWTPAIFASLAQATTHDAPEGRLGTELLRVRDVFARARTGCLVLLDELCSGTNPSEAEELVRFVLHELGAAGTCAIVTTHLLDVARHLESDPPTARLAFRRVVLDADERPTYRFSPGVADSSLARRTAERLGVTHEALAKLVKDRIGRDEAAPTKLPDELGRGG